MSVINTNVSALRAQNAMTVNARAQSTAMQQLSTGSKVNSAKDDAAGLAIGQNMTSQVRGKCRCAYDMNRKALGSRLESIIHHRPALPVLS